MAATAAAAVSVGWAAVAQEEPKGLRPEKWSDEVSACAELGMAKDTMAAKPMVLYESDNLVALASEEVAIRAIMPREIDTYDPYDEEVRVWQR